MDWGLEKLHLTQQTIQNVILSHSLTATKSSLCQNWNLPSNADADSNWECSSSEVRSPSGIRNISRILLVQIKANKLLLLVVMYTPLTYQQHSNRHLHINHFALCFKYFYHFHTNSTIMYFYYFRLGIFLQLATAALGQVDDFNCPDEHIGFYPHLYR